MNPALKCNKWLFCVFNIIFALGGFVVLTMCILLHDANLINTIRISLGVNLIFPLIVLATVSCILIIISFVGCFGTICESYRLIIPYGVLLITVLIIQLTATFYTFAKMNNNDLKKEFNIQIKNSVDHYFSRDPGTRGTALDAFQLLGECCGYDGCSDYINNYRNINKTIPGSCCQEDYTVSCEESKVKDMKGCKDVAFELVTATVNHPGVISFFTAIFEVIGLILTVRFYSNKQTVV